MAQKNTVVPITTEIWKWKAWSFLMASCTQLKWFGNFEANTPLHLGEPKAPASRDMQTWKGPVLAAGTSELRTAIEACDVPMHPARPPQDHWALFWQKPHSQTGSKWSLLWTFASRSAFQFEKCGATHYQLPCPGRSQNMHFASSNLSCAENTISEALFACKALSGHPCAGSGHHE